MTPKDNAFNIIQNIDWGLLRQQKKVLLEVISDQCTDEPNVHEKLNGIICIIDTLQDFAVNELHLQETYVFDFDDEDERDVESGNEKFAREIANTIFDIAISGEFLYMDEEIPKEFIYKIINDGFHISAIKNILREDILISVKLDNIKRNENENLIYTSDMMDYSVAIEKYCRNEYYKTKTRKVYVCPDCCSDNVEGKAWINVNNLNAICSTENEYLEEGFCNDCCEHLDLVVKEIPYLSRVIGFQVTGNPIPCSRTIYNLSQAYEIINDNNNCNLLTIWSDAVEYPIFKFEGNPRD